MWIGTKARAATRTQKVRTTLLVALALLHTLAFSTRAAAQIVPVSTRTQASAGDAGRFFERPDAPIRAALLRGEFASAERGGGGRSLGFKIRLADGTRGYFKPAQSFNGMHWNAEIAAYHLDRELGLGRVAPVVARRFAWSDLHSAAGRDGRIDELYVGDDGQLTGAFIYWVPERLVPVSLPAGWEQWLRIEPATGRSPFVRPNEYRAGRGALPHTGPVPRPDTTDRPAELSDMIVFDYLIHNADRWGTNNTNIRTLGRGGPIMYLDNAAGFTLRRPRLGLLDMRLHRVQRFRRSTIDSVRRLDMERFAARLQNDPLSPTLDRRQLANLEARRRHLIAYVDGLVARHGEEAVYAW